MQFFDPPPAAPKGLFIHREHTGQREAIALTGTLDSFGASVLERTLMRIAPDPSDRIELDLTRMDAIEPRGADILRAFLDRCHQVGVTVEVHGGDDRLVAG